MTGEQYLESADGSFSYALKEDGAYKQINIIGENENIQILPENNKPIELKQSGDELSVRNGTVQNFMTGETFTFSDWKLESRESVTGSLRLEFDQIQGEYIQTPFSTIVKEHYSDTGEILSIDYDTDFAHTPDVMPGWMPEDIISGFGIGVIPPGHSINIAFVPMGLGVLAPVVSMGPGGIPQTFGYQASNSSQNPGFVSTIKNWIGSVIGWFNGKGPDWIAKVGLGHAYDKHKNQYPNINNKNEFVQFIRNIVSKPSTLYKKLSRGREAWWDSETGTVIIKNPVDPDKGTAFKPSNGKAYFDKLF